MELKIVVVEFTTIFVIKFLSGMSLPPNINGNSSSGPWMHHSSNSISSLEQIALLKSHSTCNAGVSLSPNFRLTLAIFRMFFSCVSTQRFFPSVSLITKFAFKGLTRTNVIIKLGVVFKNGLATWT